MKGPLVTMHYYTYYKTEGHKTSSPRKKNQYPRRTELPFIITIIITFLPPRAGSRLLISGVAFLFYFYIFRVGFLRDFSERELSWATARKKNTFLSFQKMSKVRHGPFAPRNQEWKSHFYEDRESGGGLFEAICHIKMVISRPVCKRFGLVECHSAVGCTFWPRRIVQVYDATFLRTELDSCAMSCLGR